MAKIKTNPAVAFSVTFEVNEVEARALDALAGYGDDAFVQAFYEKFGTAYMRDHESGLRSFLQEIRDKIPKAIHRIDEARKAFSEIQ